MLQAWSLVHDNCQAKKLHEGMEALRTEANKLISEANDRERRTATELERFVPSHPVIYMTGNLRGGHAFWCVYAFVKQAREVSPCDISITLSWVVELR